MSDEEFTQLINEALDTGLVSEEELCHMVSFSRSGLNRWRKGQNLPHPTVRNGVEKFIQKKREEKS